MTRARTVLVIAAVLFLWNVWGHDLWAPDEPYFGEGAREMVVDGQWAVPHVNGVVTTDKPPLFFWLIALFSLPLGKVITLTARLPSILAALGTVALAMRLGRRASDARTAMLAGFVLCTLYMFWEKARWSQIDSTLCFLIWAALSAFATFRAGEADGRKAGLLFWAAAALAVLAKGPVGLLLPLGIVLVTLAVDRELSRWRAFAPLAGPGLFVLIIAGWIVLASTSGADYSVWGALKEHFIDRGIHGMHHRQPFWYYLRVLPPLLLPWTGLIPLAYVLAWRRRDPTDRFLMVVTLFVVLFFSISTEKRELYALPAYPAFALMIARGVGRVLDWEPAVHRSPDPRWLNWGQGLTGCLLLLIGMALPFAGRQVEQIPYWIPVVLTIVLVLVGVTTLTAVARGHGLVAALTPAAGFAVIYLFVATTLLPALDPVKSGRAFALKIKEATAESRAAGGRVMAYGLDNLPETFAFHSDGVYTVETTKTQTLIEHLEQAAPVFAVINGEGFGELPDELRASIREVDRTRLARRDVLLIANH